MQEIFWGKSAEKFMFSFFSFHSSEWCCAASKWLVTGLLQRWYMKLKWSSKIDFKKSASNRVLILMPMHRVNRIHPLHGVNSLAESGKSWYCVSHWCTSGNYEIRGPWRLYRSQWLTVLPKRDSAHFGELDNSQAVSNCFKNHFTLLCLWKHKSCMGYWTLGKYYLGFDAVYWTTGNLKIRIICCCSFSAWKTPAL